MTEAITIAVRSSLGIAFNYGPPKFGDNKTAPSILNKSCRKNLFSPNGAYFAYVTGQNLHLVETNKWNSICVVDNTKPYALAFSPRSTYLCTWEPFVTTVDNPKGNPNLNIYECSSGSLVKSILQKNQSSWEPQWSSDESICARLVNTDLVFYLDANFDRIVHRISTLKISSFSLSPSIDGYYAVCHVQEKSGQPGLAKLFKYPNFENQQSVASKTFFQTDKVECYWNVKGTHVLLLAMTEVHTKSYYGQQTLHFMSTTGDTAIVTLNKEGPIYDIAWSPKGHEFCAVYGFMPAKAALINLKCEIIYDFGTGPKNSVYYNPHGNILILAGFGNLPGQVKVWDASSKKIIGTCDAPDTTLLRWSPDGNNFLTATTAPRLRTGNGYKIWHYSGSLLYESPCETGVELYDASWQEFPEGTFKQPTISTEKVESIAPSHPQASKEVYRPPSARNMPIKPFNLHDDDDKSGKEATPSKTALKRKKKRENKKARQQDEGEEDSPPVTSNVEITLTGDVEKDKKIKNLKRKLDAIAKLKDQQLQGKSLEINQLAKIKCENDLLAELEQLQL